MANGSNESDLPPVLQQQLQLAREESAKSFREFREEVRDNISKSNEDLGKTLGEIGKGQVTQLSEIQKHIKQLTESNQVQIDKLQKSVAEQLKEFQSSNEKRLDDIERAVSLFEGEGVDTLRLTHGISPA